MAIQTFGVTAALVRAHYFPQMSDFSANSNPTSTTVGEMVDEAAARMGGALRAEGLTPSTLNSSSNFPEAYAWCASVIKMDAAARAMRSMTGSNPDVAKSLDESVNGRYRELAKQGHIVLGDATAPSEEANGPRTHIDAHSLDVGDDDDMSDVVPVFRRSDLL